MIKFASCNIYSFQIISVMVKASAKNEKLSLPIDKVNPYRAEILEHIGIISRHWCRKNKVEISWVVFDCIPGNEQMIFETIYEQMPVEFRQKSIPAFTYTEYKNIVIASLTDILSKGFAEFNQSLVRRDNRTWGLVAETLKRYALIWLRSSNVKLTDDFKDLHHAALSTLYEKVFNQKLSFNNSTGLKSYYFRILENKVRELKRQKMKYARTVFRIPDNVADDLPNHLDNLTKMVQEKLNCLEEKDKHVLLEYFLYERKLTEIAADMKITSEHCRVIKHRALKRLIKLLPRNLNDLI